MNETVSINLTQDQALVLFEFFARFQETDRLRMLNNVSTLHYVKLLDKSKNRSFSRFKQTTENFWLKLNLVLRVVMKASRRVWSLNR